MLGYRVPAPDEAMLVSGGRFGRNGAPFKVVTGHGAFVPPFLRKVNFLTLSMAESEVSETCVTKQGISLNVRAVIAFKVGNDEESIVNAGQRFLSDQDQMSTLTGRIFAGHLRSIIGSMTVEEIVTERQKLATEVLDGSKSEMAKIGLTVDSLQIQSIDDNNIGYIQAMAAPHNAAIQRQAQIAQAQANQASAEAQQQSQRAQAEYARQTSVVQAQYKAEVDKAQAEAAQAGPLAQAQAQMNVIAAQADLAQRQSELRQRQLVAEVIRPGRGRGAEGGDPGQGRRPAGHDAGRGGRVEQPDRARPDADRPVASDREGGGGRTGRRQHQRPERGRRSGRDRGRPGRPGADDPRVGEAQPGRAGGAEGHVLRPDHGRPGRRRGRQQASRQLELQPACSPGPGPGPGLPRAAANP
jgi:flotillin